MNKNDGKEFDGDMPRLKWRRRRWRRVAMSMIMMGWGKIVVVRWKSRSSVYLSIRNSVTESEGAVANDRGKGNWTNDLYSTAGHNSTIISSPSEALNLIS